jgi:hypothetical protein
MSTHPSALDRRTREIADAYALRGYRVRIKPQVEDLPEFLKPFSPDMVAEGPSDSVVVEFKRASGNRPPDYWAELARTVEEHPGWRYELVLDRELSSVKPEAMSEGEIRAQLDAGRKLAADQPAAALLISWAAAEAAMRLTCDRWEIELPDHRPATLVGRLYVDGWLDRPEYEQLLSLMRVRNEAAHGFRTEKLGGDAVDVLSRLALRLLQESTSPPARPAGV